MTHGQRASALRREFEAATGIWPAYPRSRVALEALRERLDRYTAATTAQAASEARRRDAADFAAEFGRLGAVDIAGSFDLDRPTDAGELEAQPAKLVGRAKKQHAREGAAHVFTSWRQETPDPYDLGDVVVNSHIRVVAGNVVEDNTIDATRAAEVLGGLEGTYLLKIKLVKEEEEGVFVVEDAFQPLRAGRTRGQAVIEITAQTNPGVLEGIDRPYFGNAYPMSAVVYGLYPIREPDPANLAPMRAGDLNCVARVALNHLESATRGHGLTAARRAKIEAWEAGIHEAGATLQDLAGLEAAARRAIIVRDIAGEILHSSGKYGAARRNRSTSHSTTATPGDRSWHSPRPEKSGSTPATSGRRSGARSPMSRWLSGFWGAARAVSSP